MSHRSAAAIPIPRIPRPPENGEIDQRYIEQLVSALESAIDVITSQQRRTFAEINLSDLQGTGDNLRIGDVFEDGGILKIVRSGDVFVGSFVGTTAVGTVTVSTP